MKIKTYAVNSFDAWLNTEGDDISGSYVKYKDHQEVVAALESKCAALAAELKQSQIDAACYKYGMEQSNQRLNELAAENAGLKECTVNHARAVEHWNSWADAEDKIPPAPETPDTDAFNRELQAQGVEAGIERVITMINHQSTGVSASINVLRTFAAQLRGNSNGGAL